ncbi:30S ribosomal protein S3 [Permianibacter aggregans]|uniref:Small ribosomal subunit protein uS3 n=1 Tax=Permianibacter aggregans TaxID=1510150 RepID=A0A4V3D7L9_9GAMM|nr:30S ribosomal protein S3 [Permianibacter aggregans]QGX40834.1 30S ribosomal protein S3 [Permianibacter aggregans]TDQ48347.1 SSU ribosomal protein S3P [Permianibacter aggregans]
MGQKVNPVGIRLGITQPWRSTWFAEKGVFSQYLDADFKVRTWLTKELAAAQISRIDIERPAKTMRVTIHTARPGVVIGKKGEDIEKLRAKVAAISGMPTTVNIEQVRKPEIDAKLVADSVAQQLERRVMFRRAMKRAVQNALRAGAKGIKIQVSGRLGGAEIARTEWYREGRVPLHTLRADIDYATGEASTTYGIIGVKVWIFKGEVLAQGRIDINSVSAPAREDKEPKRRPKGRAGAGANDKPRAPRRSAKAADKVEKN